MSAEISDSEAAWVRGFLRGVLVFSPDQPRPFDYLPTAAMRAYGHMVWEAIQCGADGRLKA
jgi:hypothetical protein